MSDSIDYLFTFQGHELEAVFSVLDMVKSLLMRDADMVLHLTDILKNYRVKGFTLEQHDSELVDNILDTLLNILEDESSLHHLVNKLKKGLQDFVGSAVKRDA
jgi:hypothetical protein